MNMTLLEPSENGEERYQLELIAGGKEANLLDKPESGREVQMTSVILEKTYDEMKRQLDEQTAGLLDSVQDLKKELEKGRQAKEALHESEERFRSMMEAVNDPVFICSSDLMVTYVNPAMKKRIRSDAVGQPCYQVIHSRDAACTWCVYDKIKKGQSVITDLTSPLDHRFYSFSHSPIFHRDGTVSMMTVLRDLTNQKETENALRESETRYRNLAEQVIDGVVVIQNGTVAFVNPAFAAMFGHKSPEELSGKKLEEMKLTDSDRFITDVFQCLNAGDPHKEMKETYAFSNGGDDRWIEGHHKWIKWEGRPAVLSTISDVTDKKLHELAMQEETQILREENARLKSSMKERYRLGNIIGKSPAIQKVYDLILMACGSGENVIIYGESGTGKELVAREIHRMSKRRDKAFVTVNCGAIPETLLESEFFGYKKGAFTGAMKDKYGYLDLADDGTLFLDEVGELNVNMQVKLLRAIDAGEYTPIGSNRSKKSSFRIIAATNRNLMEQIQTGHMRKDFFYRIHVIPIEVPALRERKEDLPLLIEHFLGISGNGKGRNALPSDIFHRLYTYHWPGNVRELENVIKRYLTIKRLDFVETTCPREDPVMDPPHGALEQEIKSPNPTLEAIEKGYIIKVLEANRWHKAKTAAMLGIPERTFYRKLRKYQLMPA